MNKEILLSDILSTLFQEFTKDTQDPEVAYFPHESDPTDVVTIAPLNGSTLEVMMILVLCEHRGKGGHRRSRLIFFTENVNAQLFSDPETERVHVPRPRMTLTYYMASPPYSKETTQWDQERGFWVREGIQTIIHEIEATDEEFGYLLSILIRLKYFLNREGGLFPGHWEYEKKLVY